MKEPSQREPIKNLPFFDDTLNESQKTAVRFCLESPEVACIHGPPGISSGSNKGDIINHQQTGTGKTHTLIEIIRQLTMKTDANPEPKRVLVCGASNLSVDNILERLLSLATVNKAQQLKVTRIGHPARVMAQEGILESILEVRAGRTDEVSPLEFLRPPYIF